MLSHICLCMMLMTVIYINTVNTIPAPLTDNDLQNQKFSDSAMIERFDNNQYLINRLYNDDNINDDEILHDKRQLKKKWAKFYQGAQSPYTIAFPALIRTRR